MTRRDLPEPRLRVVQDLIVKIVEQDGRQVRVGVVGELERAVITFAFDHEEAAAVHADQARTWMVTARRLTYVRGPLESALIDDAEAFSRAFEAPAGAD